ncbi:MAG: hypothetical protein WB630_06205, partial [Candidatus Acidiferrales bacterium]
SPLAEMAKRPATAAIQNTSTINRFLIVSASLVEWTTAQWGTLGSNSTFNAEGSSICVTIKDLDPTAAGPPLKVEGVCNTNGVELSTVF